MRTSIPTISNIVDQITIRMEDAAIGYEESAALSQARNVLLDYIFREQRLNDIIGRIQAVTLNDGETENNA